MRDFVTSASESHILDFMAFRKSSGNRYLPNRRMKSNKNAIFNRGRQPHIRCYGRQNTEYLWAVLLPLKVVASKRENYHKMFERWKARKKEEENEEEEEVSMMRLLENSLNAKRVNETAVNAIACSSWGEISQHSLSFGSADGLYLHLSHSFSLSRPFHMPSNFLSIYFVINNIFVLCLCVTSISHRFSTEVFKHPSDIYLV